ncbi:MAG: AAA family ATPase [Dehalogenimonas sp.]|uniref:AAA family ATPase n=1 Tax=Candidatus Dehalogenimonas loeffleri TaxID=3127115 RepID=A0ABZ2J7H7_9CHLR|nr:AAA family ATPase [Dehalogenimonas sp.]
MQNKLIHTNPITITGIYVERLFGKYTYRIPEHKNIGLFTNLIILYGENGTGKTKLLSILYHILSPARAGGHRSYIAKIPFGLFRVDLSNGMSVSAERTTSKIIGDFTWSISKGKKVLASASLQADSRGSIPKELPPDIEEDHSKVVEILETLGINLVFLADNREIQGTSPITETIDFHGDKLVLERPFTLFERDLLFRSTQRDKADSVPLLEAINQLTTWIRDRVVEASNRGDTNASTIYTDLIKTIASIKRNEIDVTDVQVADLRNTLLSLSEINKQYSDLGLLPQMNLETVAETIKSVDNQAAKNALYSVTKPYIDGITARFKALEEIKDIINIFLRNINGFYKDKLIQYNYSTGISIKTNEGQALDQAVLSSGEKQLLLLFCHAVAVTNTSRIFVIDEPEISLNVTWQRKLVRALLECTSKSQFQLILATHSIELLTQHSDHVAELNNLMIKQ